MKRIAILLVALVGLTAAAQDYGRVAINVVVPTLPNVPEEARAALETKMQQVATQYGIASNGLTDRFVMTAKVNITSKDITPSTPVKISQKLEVTMFIGDVMDNKVYESVVFNVAGIGQSEDQSMIKAFAQIKPSNPKLKAFVENAGRKIADYYAANCQFILTEANTLASQRQYDAAIAKLMAVPEVCAECYEQCMDKATNIYQRWADDNGKGLVQQARAAWTATRDYASAESALQLLAQIAPHSAAQADAQSLIAQIDKHLRSEEAKAEAREQRDWEFRMKQYEDSLSMAKQEQKDRTLLRRELIAAARKVGVAYGKNQPKSITNNNFKTW